MTQLTQLKPQIQPLTPQPPNFDPTTPTSFTPPPPFSTIEEQGSSNITYNRAPAREEKFIAQPPGDS